MRAELKRLHSPDIYDLRDYEPEKPDEFNFLLQVMVAPKGSGGEESFDVEVCTLKWLENNFAAEDIIMGCHYLIV